MYVLLQINNFLIVKNFPQLIRQVHKLALYFLNQNIKVPRLLKSRYLIDMLRLNIGQ